MTDHPRYWAIVPAAGVGQRMKSSTPKQFLMLGEKTILEHSLDVLWEIPRLAGLVLVSNDNPVVDAIIKKTSHRNWLRTIGGEQRCHSVLNGLLALKEYAAAGDWVLVHDAARPCVRIADLTSMLDTLSAHEVGGVLGLPVHDTMKSVDHKAEILQTLDRNHLWHAFTPQMFRYAVLKSALEQALQDGYEVTDEASAMEHIGAQPLMIEGHADNLKITRPEDVQLATFYLQQQGRL